MKNTGYRIKKNKKIVTHYLLLVAIFLLFTIGYSYAGNYQITNIEVIDNAVKIKVDGPIKYKVARSADPFRVIVDIEGVSTGRFKDKIYSRQAGITEISLTQIETPVVTARFDILLENPSTIIRPEMQGDILILNVEPKVITASSNDSQQLNAQKPTFDTQNPTQKVDNIAKEIAAVIFDKTDEGTELVIKGNGIMPEPTVFELDGKIIVDIPAVTMKASLPSSLLYPVKDLNYEAENGKVRFTVGIDGKVNTEVFAMEDEIIVDMPFKQKMVEQKMSKAEDEQSRSQSSHDAHRTASDTQLVSLDFQDADIVPILRLLGDVSGYNIVVHPDVKGKITMKLMNVPWEQALNIVLKTFNLEKVVEGNVIRIATLKAFQEEKKAVAETREVFGKAEDITTRVFTVNYSNVEKIRNSIEKGKLLSPRGSISVDTRTRSLIVKDIPSNLVEIQKLINNLDKQTPQVLIESRIVEMNTNFSKSLGVEWGSQYRPRMGDDNTTLSGGLGTTVTGGQSTGVGLVNLPATTTKIVSPTSAITLGYLNAAQTFGLDLRLSAIEAVGKAKLLSTPKIMTLENEQAIIRHGKRIPVTTPGTTQGTYTTTYIDANLKITVTPQVAPDSTILMKIEVNKDEPDFANKDTLGNPAIDTRSVSTQVLVKDGETVVIGGILKSSESNSDSGVPGLSKIPLLGWLFKKETKETSSEELLIFITPKIVKQQ
ncbi:PilQ [Dissulfurispira thermophila]|uniref:PilQ n=1 Tax=Dissulfurispira thermophila TaxID=2715679 RepID=A0A7G1H047_9BACT|nr:type IV pilus secretin PilQ [Dissulfurispira thermophila]BCB95501.1 PilQ [Dissulfurispira thermophila]